MTTEAKITDFLATHHLASGLGTVEEPCSIAAINLALTKRLTDDIPDCMSPVVGQWIIRVQDSMPDAIRNSAAWKALLPLAAGTGRDSALEQRRASLLLDWMWADVLPQLQRIADKLGLCFGVELRTMLVERNEDAAVRAARAAAWAAAQAARAAWAADAVWAATWAAEAAARAAEAAADAGNFWANVDPVEVLHKLVNIRGDEA